jgi:hypothetical protein
MTKVLEDAIEKVRKLPEDRQAYVAEVLEQIAAAGSEPFIVPEAHRAALLEGLRAAERGEFASDEEMAALWKKCGPQDSRDAVVPANERRDPYAAAYRLGNAV